MDVIYIYRSKKVNEFSIENVFDTVVSDIDKKCNIEKVYVPEVSNSLINMIKNIIFVRKLKADVYHITGDVHYLAMFLNKKKVVLTIHDLSTLKHKKGLKKFLLNLIWYYLPIRGSEKITVISDKTMQEVLNYFPFAKNKIEVINNPINREFTFSPNNTNSRKPVILQVGTRENKNLERVILAISQIDCLLTIIGKLSVKQKEMLESFDVEYQNYSGISNEEVVQKYRDADLIVFASTYEGFGLPIIESQAIGRPVVTSQINPMNQISGGAAMLVDPYDVESIRTGINRLLNDKELKNKLIVKGLENAKKYTPANIGNEYMEIYKSIYKL